MGEMHRRLLSAIRHEISVSRGKTWAINGGRIVLTAGLYFGVSLLVTAACVLFGLFLPGVAQLLLVIYFSILGFFGLDRRSRRGLLVLRIGRFRALGSRSSTCDR